VNTDDFDRVWFARIRDAARAATPDTDPAHDFAHVLRVASNARTIATREGANVSIVVTAALLHELFNYPKDHPDSARSGEVCADRSEALLRDFGFPAASIATVTDAIRVHGFSRGIDPDTLEARILQDADRLDAIGAIGIARCFATCATMHRPFYSPDDPMCRTREPDDKRWGVDHFFRKLLHLHERMHTETARAMAARRAEFTRAYLAELDAEVNETSPRL
jgi:uncharacterized protein